MKRDQEKIQKIVFELREALDKNGSGSRALVVDYDGFLLETFPEVTGRAGNAIKNVLREYCTSSDLELKHFRFYVPVKVVNTTAPEREIEALEMVSDSDVPRVLPPPRDELEPPVYVEELPPPVEEELRINSDTPPVRVAPPPPPVPIKKNVPVQAEIIDFPDIEASFPGGVSAFQEYLKENLQYPETSMKLQEQGCVYLSFVVEIDGSITQVRVDRGVSKDLDREAKRLIRVSPKWVPAEAGGKKVRMRCRYPVVFELPK